MFWKLCKFEFRNSYRSYGIMYTVLLLSAIFLRIGFMMQWNGYFPGIVLVFYMGSCFALLILCFVNIVRNYYNSMFKRSAYLTHTLPVITWQTVLSKTLAGVFWLLLTTLVIALSFLILDANANSITLTRLQRQLFNIHIDMAQLGWVILYSIRYLLEVLGFISMLYLVISAAHTKYVHHHRVLASVGLFILCSIAMSTLSMICFFLYESVSISINDPYAYMNVNNAIWIAINVMIFILFFFANVYLLNHKMEVE